MAFPPSFALGSADRSGPAAPLGGLLGSNPAASTDGSMSKDAAARRVREERRAEDAAWIASTLKGDDDAFRRLVEKYQKAVYWVAYDVLLDAEEARDVAQETFLRVHGALTTFDPARDFSNWLLRIARNLAIDAHRRRRRRAAPVEDLTTVPAAEPANAEDGDVRARVASILARMPVEYRLALTLREFHDLTPREISAITDCSYPTARWRLHRARRLFQRLWEEKYGPSAQEES